MKDDDGQVLIKGFYDGIEPLHADEAGDVAVGARRRAQPDEAVRDWPRRSARADAAAGGAAASLNIRGLSSAYTGPDARTIIPDTATAALDIRLVKETPARAMADKWSPISADQGYLGVETDPIDELRAKHPPIARS